MVTFRDPGLSVGAAGPLTGPGAGLGGGNAIFGAGAQAGPFPLLSPRAAPPLTGPGALGPRIISTGTPDPTTTGSTGGGDVGGTGLPTLDALLARQKELGQGGVKMGEMISPWQGASYALQKGIEGFQQGKVDRDILAQEAARADILSSLDPSGIATPEQIAAMSQVDEDLAATLYETAMKMRAEQMKLEGEGGPKLSDENSMRSNFENDPAYTNLSQAAPMWTALQKTWQRGTSQSDLNMIIGIAKLMDPGSVVRTEEGVMVRQTGGLSNEVISAWNYLTSNKEATLDSAMRKNLMREGWTRMQGYKQAYDELSRHYSDIATRGGVDPRNIVRPFEIQPWVDPDDPNGTGTGGGGGGGGGGGTPAPDEEGPPPIGTIEIDPRTGKKRRYKGGDEGEETSWEEVT